jgi:hypothetical protein
VFTKLRLVQWSCVIKSAVVIERRIIWLLAVLIGFGALLAVPIPRPAGNTEVAAIVWLTQESSEEQIPPDTPRAPEVPPDTRPITYQTIANSRIFSNSLHQRPPPFTPLA